MLLRKEASITLAFAATLLSFVPGQFMGHERISSSARTVQSYSVSVPRRQCLSFPIDLFVDIENAGPRDTRDYDVITMVSVIDPQNPSQPVGSQALSARFPALIAGDEHRGYLGTISLRWRCRASRET